MLTEFLSSLGGSLADRWMAASLPAACFWLGGLAAWLTAHGGSRRGAAGVAWVASRPGITQALLLAAALLVVAGSARLVRRLTLPTLRLLEGYGWPDPLRRRLVARASRRQEATMASWRDLAAEISAGTASPEQQRRFVLLDARRRLVPAMAARRMPTRLGNILRAAECQPLDKYGLDTVVCWPRLWMVLPAEVKREIAAARSSLDGLVTVWLWSVLFIGWSVWTPWALVALVAGAVSYRWMLSSADLYGQLVECAFDLYRQSLYRALRWPLPSSPAEERAVGAELTIYLWRGSDQACPVFHERDG